VLLVGKMAIDAFLGKKLWSKRSATFMNLKAASILPLPHASGASRWLNDPTNAARHDQALSELSRLRVELGL